jgi:hypothetical protein
MRTAATIVGFLFMLSGFAAFAWPFPLFTLNEPYLSWYTANVLQVDAKPGGASAALPFLWIVTAPFGLCLVAVGIPVLHWGRAK